MSGPAIIENLSRPILSLVTSAPALFVLVSCFLIVSTLESWRPFFRQSQDSGRRLLTNFGFGLANAGIQFAVPLSVLTAASWAGQNGIGLLNNVEMPLAVEGVASVLLYSLATYWMHRLSHRVPLLWRLHHIHHADTQIDLSTGFRNHPGELVVAILMLSLTVVVFGLSPFFLISYQIVAAGFALWSHADFALPQTVDRILRAIFVTPGMHHVHHSSLQLQTDSNYGEVFSFWDRLFGSYCYMTPAELHTMRIGLGDAHDVGAHNFFAQLASPARRPPF